MHIVSPSRILHLGLVTSLFMCAAVVLSGCGLSIAGPTARTTVIPLPTDDLARPCSYDLLLQDPERRSKGLLVIFDRADSEDLYNDLSVRDLVGVLGFGMIFAHECNARSYGDLQADASKGPGRALVTALHQFALATNHRELDTAGMILYGFSAAGVLTATMANAIPTRMMGAIEYASGSGYVNLDDILVSAAATRIPTLVLANAKDEDAGTARSYRYFLRGRVTGMPPWAYAVQNATDHCCNLSTRNLILPWIQAVASQQTSLSAANGNPQAFAPAPTTGQPALGALAHFTCTPNGDMDAQGDINCVFTRAKLGVGAVASREVDWLPDLSTATAWLYWVTNPDIN